MIIIDQIKADLARAEALTRDEERSGIVHGANWRTAQRLRAELNLLEATPVTTEPSLEESHLELILWDELDREQ